MLGKMVRLLVASGALLFALSSTHAQATVTKTATHAVHKKAKPAAKKSPQQSLTIVTKAANDAPDFDYQARIEEAQALVEKQPVLKGDMQFDGQGNLTHFVWTLAAGQKTGPLTILRMDETGRNDQGFTVTWAVDNFLNTKFHVANPKG
ncbi:MAG TPA: hypothetical protein VEV64_09235 [Rhizomicrobium sp.]|nr:hypothetical protein [Rhizomicrobium sp.]